MSRSFKHIRVIKDKSKFYQTLGDRIMRRIVKSKLKDITEDMILPTKKNEIVNQYNITDWKAFDFKFTWFGKGKNKKIFK